MKRSVCVLSAIIIIICSCTACEGSRHSVLRSGQSEFYSIANFSVPFISGSFDWDIVNELERDSYGRIMFKYRSLHCFDPNILRDYSGGYTYTIIICQKYDKNYAYYYENYNFIYLPDYDNISDSDIAKLKEWNDWDKPLNESKMAKVANSFDPYEKCPVPKRKHEEKNDIVLKWLPKNENVLGNIEYVTDALEVDNYGRRLSVVGEYTKNEDEYTFYDSYFVVCDENLDLLTENGKPCILKIEDVVHCQDDMKTIKERSNWNKPR